MAYLHRLSAEQLAVVKQVVASLNADAKIIETDYAKVDLDQILNTGLFDDEKAEMHPLWAKELYGYADHRPETEEYGVESFVYRARRPFDPSRFYDFLTQNGLDTVIRAKADTRSTKKSCGAQCWMNCYRCYKLWCNA